MTPEEIKKQSDEMTAFCVERWMEIQNKYSHTAELGTVMTNFLAFFFYSVPKEKWPQCWDAFHSHIPALVEALKKDLESERPN